MELLDGKLVSKHIYQKLQNEVEQLKRENIIPKLVIILVGDNAASLSYIKSKLKRSDEIGIETELMKFSPDEMTTEKLISLIDDLNNDQSVNGILVQLPLPKHIYEPDVIKAIDPAKDVDGFTAYNLGKVFLDPKFEDLPPCTPAGVIEMFDYYNIDVTGKEACIVGKSNIAGKPMAVMLLNRHATVTVCHRETKDLAKHTKEADIIVVAVGKPHLITFDMVKDGSIIVDIGINRLEDGRLVGDVDFENVSKKASYITPVPGGCGLMTVACLTANVVKAAKKQHNLK